MNKLLQWFFPKRKPLPVIEFEPRPPSPCGDDEVHYYWTDDCFPCPACRAQIQEETTRRFANEEKAKMEIEEQRRLVEQEALAQRVADIVVARLKAEK